MVVLVSQIISINEIDDSLFACYREKIVVPVGARAAQVPVIAVDLAPVQGVK